MEARRSSLGREVVPLPQLAGSTVSWLRGTDPHSGLLPPQDSQALAMAAGGGAARVWVPCWLSRGSCSRPA